jgi:hypothetical protein
VNWFWESRPGDKTVITNTANAASRHEEARALHKSEWPDGDPRKITLDKNQTAPQGWTYTPAYITAPNQTPKPTKVALRAAVEELRAADKTYWLNIFEDDSQARWQSAERAESDLLALIDALYPEGE